jgi:DNA-binding transcriptional MerR regulator
MAAPPKRYKVGEIMRHTGLSRQTIHNYTMLGLITPVERTESGHRLYGEEVFDRIRRIELLKIHRTLQEIKEHLDSEQQAGQG